MISIITPTYNREVLVQRTIHSVLKQTYQNWELVVVDDGSTDKTEEIMKSFLSDARIKYIKKENTGQAHSLNVGVSHATKEFIVFLDSDDEAYPNWLEEVACKIENDTALISVGANRKLLDGTILEEPVHDYNLFGKNYRVKFTCGSFFIRKSIFEAIGGYDISMRSNIQTDLCIRLIHYLQSKDLKVFGIDKFLVQINIHDQPRIRNNWAKVRDGSLQLLNKHYDLIYKHDPKTTSIFYSIIAHSSFKLKNRKDAITYMSKAIKTNPKKIRNYLRFLKYSFTAV